MPTPYNEISTNLLADFYKIGHPEQYPKTLTRVQSNLTPRSSKNAKSILLPDYDDRVVVFGIQSAVTNIQIRWDEQFFRKDLEDVLAEYREVCAENLFNPNPVTQHIEDLHALGYLPITISGFAEGTRVGIRTPVVLIENTHDNFPWLPGLLEDQLSCEIWKPMTVATIAYEYRRLFEFYAKKTGGDLSFVAWQGHDFSLRGTGPGEDGAICGMGHLTSFYGTDTIPSIRLIKAYYKDTPKGKVIGGSVPATEHTVMQIDGPEGEKALIVRLLTEVYPTGIVSIVSDTTDFFNVVTNTVREVKDVILGREGKFVVRPDTGFPPDIICGDPNAPEGSPEWKGAIRCLWEVFGGTITSTGHKLLDSHIGLIYGDSITLKIAEEILRRLDEMGFASTNIVLGIGSFTYQHLTRDTFGTAIKLTWCRHEDGTEKALFKKPKTDTDGTKFSARGYLVLTTDEAGTPSFREFAKKSDSVDTTSASDVYFLNGKIWGRDFEEVRNTLHPTWELI